MTIRKSFISLLFLVVALSIYFATPVGEMLNPANIPRLQANIRSFGIYAPIIYVGLYVVATVLVFPGSVLTLIAPTLFGGKLAFLLVVIASNLGANLAFLVARFLGRESIEKLLNHKIKGWKLKLEGSWFQWIVTLRLIPLFPFNIVNYLCGFTRLSWPLYAAGTFIGMLPGTFAYVWLGNVGNEIAKEGSKSISWSDPMIWGPFALVGILSWLPSVWKKRRLKTQRNGANH